MKYEYRIGTENDLEELIQIGLNSYGQFKNELTKENWLQLKSFLMDKNGYADLLKKSTCFVCTRNEKIVGMAFLVRKGNPTDIFQKDWSYLRMVNVNPEESGNGIGRKITQLCIEQARKEKENIIILHTSEMQKAAIHLYESIGFKKFKRIPDHLGKKYWLFSLEI